MTRLRSMYLLIKSLFKSLDNLLSGVGNMIESYKIAKYIESIKTGNKPEINMNTILIDAMFYKKERTK
ncbi:hypothetical protein BHU61_06650 [Macrococcus epidermidis]|uniref:Uncharacterized protein n=1 Tax=Macrococcus epidermidis TaxID=1902580 RepID=A0A327ZS53_9STAP|nr:hypothetical protein [Macrococcus epidermidis]RAK44987.1 hypothetical protein BHU61_06650 [Macrococcus epidermidis]